MAEERGVVMLAIPEGLEGFTLGPCATLPRHLGTIGWEGS